MSEVAKLHIDGDWVESQSQTKVPSTNPGTGDTVGDIALARVDDLNEAIAAAKSAIKRSGWADSPRIRAAVLLKFADRLEANKDEIARQMSQENGKLLGEARHEVFVSISELRYYAGLARNIFGRVMEIEPSLYSMLKSEPLGVAGIIVPWNAPVTLLIRSLAPALAAGCTTIVKPALQTAITNAKVLELLTAIEILPKGVVNVIAGDVDVSKALVDSLDVDVISYTGSTHVGKEIMAAGASSLKRMNLELGGSAPCVVMPDANISKAVAGISKAAFAHAGQVCMAASRVFVHESIAEQFQDRLVQRFISLRIGMMDDPEAQMGPVIDTGSVNRILGLVETAGADDELLVRGERLEGDYAKGSFLSPSLLRVNSAQSPMLTGEVFGPAVSISVFADEEVAIVKANDTRFGLCASVWTEDLAAGQRVANKLEAGTVWINQHMRTHAEIEAGGYKESGLGRLHGVEGLMEFMHSKHISWELKQEPQRHSDNEVDSRKGLEMHL